jgi:hypothetical protein
MKNGASTFSTGFLIYQKGLYSNKFEPLRFAFVNHGTFTAATAYNIKIPLLKNPSSTLPLSLKYTIYTVPSGAGIYQPVIHS